SRWQRFLIVLATYVGYPLVYLIGRSLRWTVLGWEHWQPLEQAGVPTIFVSWHNGLMAEAWYFRGRGIVAMVTQNFDGEYIARIIEKLGFAAARGSSSRGGMKALHEMAHHLHQGRHVAFTVDGPRGPCYVAKIGPVLLAQRTGRPIV